MLMTILAASVAMAVAMAAAWGVQRLTLRSGWVDTIWTFATGLVGAGAALALPREGSAPRAWLVATLALIWALRLGLALMLRTLKGGEDPRYLALRQAWGTREAWRLFWFLQIQAAASVALVSAMLAAAQNNAPFVSLGDTLGVLAFGLGVAGAGLADAQMARFRASQSGGVCQIGLWRYSRHPNYFFEWIAWLAYPLIAIGGEFAPLALIAPGLIYWLLVHVSGIPPLEEHMLKSRGAAFAEYVKRTNAFFPWAQRDA